MRNRDGEKQGQGLRGQTASRRMPVGGGCPSGRATPAPRRPDVVGRTTGTRNATLGRHQIRHQVCSRDTNETRLKSAQTATLEHFPTSAANEFTLYELGNGPSVLSGRT